MSADSEIQTNPNENKPVESQPAKVEVSASTIARMMGVATSTEVKLLDGKIDLLSSKLNSVIAKVERLQSLLNSIPTVSDLDRIDIQIGGLKTILREIVPENAGTGSQEAAEQSKKLKAAIRSNTAE